MTNATLNINVIDVTFNVAAIAIGTPLAAYEGLAAGVWTACTAATISGGMVRISAFAAVALATITNVRIVSQPGTTFANGAPATSSQQIAVT